MTTLLSQAIDDFIATNISLVKIDISSAAASREWFLKRIKTQIDKSTSGLRLYADTPFVHFGSYFKQTKIMRVDEFDILVVIDSNEGQFSSGSRIIGNGLGAIHPNPKYNSKYRKSDDSGVSPSKLLNWLRGISENITGSYRGESPERNGQAITATIKSKNLKIDLVPAGIFQKMDGTIFYNIPKGDAENSWILTNPKEDIARLIRVAKNNDHLRRVVRLSKYIAHKDHYNIKIPSFAIETVIVNYAENNRWSVDLAKNLIEALKCLAKELESKKIADPFDPSTNMISGIDNLQWYSERINGIVANLNTL